MVDTVAARKPSVREQVVAEATRLFAASGFEATPLQDIADAVGISKPAVLHHFPSKEHIRIGVMEAIFAHWRDQLPRLLLSATESHARFDTVLGEVYRFFAANPDRARFVSREVLDRPAQARAMLGTIAPMLRGIAGYIRAGLGDKADDVDPDAYVIHVMQMVIGASAMADVTSVMLGDGATGRARYDRELTRIAKSSLFGRRGARPRESSAAPSRKSTKPRRKKS
ncbi:MAG TPA: TetR/AcrR family transcriptional regulator [Kofleriaceae bacterium]|nr:TetR/AcrR family transcriptional regulator [Kofleriaceae bacterium]